MNSEPITKNPFVIRDLFVTQRCPGKTIFAIFLKHFDKKQ